MILGKRRGWVLWFAKGLSEAQRLSSKDGMGRTIIGEDDCRISFGDIGPLVGRCL